MRRVAGVILALVTIGFTALPAAGAGASPLKPCAKHAPAKKPACLKAYKRSKLEYPPRPTWAEFKNRAGGYYAPLRQIAVCEMGGTGKGEPWDVRWGLLYSKYSSAFGIWNGNFAYTSQATGYPWPTSNKAEEAFHALALAKRYGLSAWGCWHG